MNRLTGLAAIVRSSALALFLISLFSSSLRAQNPPETDSTPLTPFQTALLDYHSGHYDAAREAINEAEKEKPNDYATDILKARILTELGAFTEGEEILRRYLTANQAPVEVEIALGDLLLRKRDFEGASKMYTAVLQAKPNDPDLTLKLVYARIGASDLVTAAKYASQLRPLDSDHPCYYFAKAALAQATGKGQEAEDDIEPVRTLYGISVADRYLKTYLEVLVPVGKDAAASSSAPASGDASSPPPKTNP